TSDATDVALLATMGLEAGTERRARATLVALQTAAAQRTLAPARVVPVSRARVLPVGRIHVGAARVQWRLEVIDEHGDTRCSEGTARAGDLARGLRLPLAPTLGYYRIALQIGAAGAERRVEQ